MKNSGIKLTMLLSLLTVATSIPFGCSKDFLKENPRTDLVVPATYKEMQALLDNDAVMNQTPAMGEISSDNYYMTDTYWQTLLLPHERNCYIWEPDIYQGQLNIEDWSRSYTQVLHSNVVLEQLKEIEEKSGSELEFRNIKGSALFFRAHAFYNLAQIFAPVYDNQTAQTDLGIPLRDKSDINAKYPRASVQSTYDWIINDLNEAENLVPDNVDISRKNRPSKPAVLGLKARVYLSMREYQKAMEAADLALQLYDSLLDFNELDTVSLAPFRRENKETIFQSHLINNGILYSIVFPEVIVDSNLYNSYTVADLRRLLFFFDGFSGYKNIKATFSGNVLPFSGIATDELLLIRAECKARADNINDALEDLNTLLVNRFKAGQYTPYSALTKEEALTIILEERRKELPYRGLRWMDLRRLNKEGYGITLQRKLNGKAYTLQPNSKLYVLPIPPDVLTSSGIPDNDRQ